MRTRFVSLFATLAILLYQSGIHATDIFVTSSATSTITKVDSITGASSLFVSAGSGLNSPNGLAFDSSGNLFAGNYGNNTISKIDPTGNVTLFAGGISTPNGLAFDAAGNLFVANQNTNTISKITSGGIVSVFATGLSVPVGLAFDSAGNLYSANYSTGTVLRFDPAGNRSTFAGGFANPTGLAFDSAGYLYVANSTNSAINKVSPSGSVSSFVPSTGFYGRFGLAFDLIGNLYAANFGLGSLTKTTSDGSTSTILGGLSQPTFVAVREAAVPEPSTVALGLLSALVCGYSLVAEELINTLVNEALTRPGSESNRFGTGFVHAFTRDQNPTPHF